MAIRNSKKPYVSASSCVSPTMIGILLTMALIVSLLYNFVDLHRQTRIDFNQYYSMFTGRRCDESNTKRLFDSATFTDPNPNMPWPRIAWLMSFPNSGTSYTMKLVSRASNRSVASNYGAECELDPITGTNRPVFHSSFNAAAGGRDWTHPTDTDQEGPFLVHFTDRQLPTHYILTKTHCGSRCTACSPTNYIETKESFMSMCSKGSKIYGKMNITTKVRIPQESKKVDIRYNPYLAQRAIHLIRNTSDNIVSNFHLERNEKKKQQRHDWLSRYPNTMLGFKKYCQDLDSKHGIEESNIRFLPSSIVQLFPNIPCHAAFFVYIQWHNLAIQVQQQLHIPTLIVYYEDYQQDWNHTIQRIFDFLHFNPWGEEEEQQQQTIIPPFVSGKRYIEYYTDKERNATNQFIKRLADPTTLELLKRYL